VYHITVNNALHEICLLTCVWHILTCVCIIDTCPYAYVLEDIVQHLTKQHNMHAIWKYEYSEKSYRYTYVGMYNVQMYTNNWYPCHTLGIKL
jgi:hypothetical protein